jgi:dolichol-phosphate mannosyltransferase
MDPEITVVLPVCNEEHNIGVLLREIAAVFDGAVRRRYELIVVDDGSHDRSAEMARSAMDCLRTSRFFTAGACLEQGERKGQSAALTRGVAAARGELIVTLDADLQYDPADIVGLLDKTGAYDMVCGIRSERKDGAARLACSKIANAFRNFITGDTTIDSGCTLRVIRKECAPAILVLDGRLSGCELLFFPLFVRHAGFRVGEQPVRHRRRGAGTSKYRLIQGRLLRGIGACLRAKKILRPSEH